MRVAANPSRTGLPPCPRCLTCMGSGCEAGFAQLSPSQRCQQLQQHPLHSPSSPPSQASSSGQQRPRNSALSSLSSPRTNCREMNDNTALTTGGDLSLAPAGCPFPSPPCPLPCPQPPHIINSLVNTAPWLLQRCQNLTTSCSFQLMYHSRG